jgi:transposase
LSPAAVREGRDRAEAAKVGGMDRQTLRDWVHRFNAEGPEGLLDHRSEGPKSRLTPAQLAALAKIVEAGPDLKTEGVVRWRRMDLKAVIAKRFGVAYHERSVGKLLSPRHSKQDERIVGGLQSGGVPASLPGLHGGGRSLGKPVSDIAEFPYEAKTREFSQESRFLWVKRPSLRAVSSCYGILILSISHIPRDGKSIRLLWDFRPSYRESTAIFGSAIAPHFVVLWRCRAPCCGQWD